MSKNQRKDIIHQIQDLSKSRKSVRISDIKSTGINFLDGDGIVVGGEGENSLIIWDKISYLQDIGDSIPSAVMFQNLDNMISPRISDSDIASLSGLRDSAIEYQKNIKYTTIISPTTTRDEHLTFSGECKATVYINDRLVLNHTYTTEQPTTTTRIRKSFLQGEEYKIEVFVYGHKKTRVTNSALSLSSNVFQFVKYSKIPTLSEPKNVFATTNLPDTIKVSWEQIPTAPLTGGGTEIWAKSSDIDATYTFLDRVSHPTSFYMHSSALGPQNILPNGNLQDIISADAADTPIPTGLPEDPTGLLNWGVSYSGGDLRAVPSELEDYTTFLRFTENRINNIYMSEVDSYSLPYPDDINNINTGVDVNLSYTTTRYIKTKSSVEAPVASGGATILFTWQTSDIVTDARVRCIVYRNGTPTTTYADLSEGSCSVSLSLSDVISWNGDPDWIQTEFRVWNSDKNSDPATTGIQLKSIVCSFLHSNSDSNLEFTGVLIPFSYGDDYVYEYTYRISGTLNGAVTRFEQYDAEGTFIGYTGSYTTSGSGIYTGTWKTSSSTVDTGSFNTNTKFLKPIITFSVKNLLSGNNTLDIQKLYLLKTSTKSLPPYDSYEYKLRNYTKELSISPFTLPVKGRTSEEVYYLSLDSEDSYVSTFLKSKLNVSATTPLGTVTVEALSDSGNYTIPLQQIGASSNGADFTFEYKPLYSVPVIYDTFNYDRILADIDNPPASYDFVHFADSFEESPARQPALQYTLNPGVISVEYATDLASPWGLWPNKFPNADSFRTMLRLSGGYTGNYKRYDLTKLSSFYRNIHGNTDIPTGSFHHTAPENKTKISVGMLYRLRQDLGATTTFCEANNLFRLTFYRNPDNGILSLICWIRADGYVPNSQFGDIILRHDVEVDLTDWYYLHISADVNAIEDPSRTYITLHNVSNYPDTTVANSYVNAGGYVNGLKVLRGDLPWWTWSQCDHAKLGCLSGSGHTFAFDIDTFYVTADVLDKKIIDGVTSQVIAESKNPYFSSFGYKSGQKITYYAEGLTSSASGIGQSEGAIPYDADLLTDEFSQTIDWEEPDGTCYILREAFTINQSTLDDIADLQNTYTYSRWNKIYVDFTSPYSEVYKVRFSHDNESWGKWRNFNDEILYPWQLLPLGQPNDSSEGGLRTVYTQVISKSGNTSDPITSLNHRDNIIYNPIGSIGSIESYNYVRGQAGWSLDLNGDAEFNKMYLRDGVINLGTNLSGINATEGYISSQLPFKAETQHKVTDNHFIRPYTSPQDSGTYRYRSYNSDIVGDIQNRDHLFVPLKYGTDMVVSRLEFEDVGLDVPMTTVYAATIDAGLDPYAMAHVALTENHVYVAAKNVVRKYDKTNYAEGQHTASASTNRSCVGLKCAYAKDGSLRIYACQTTIADGWMQVFIFDENLNQIQLCSRLMEQTGYGTFRGHMFDCNGAAMVYLNNGVVYYHKLNDNGLSFNTALSSTNHESRDIAAYIKNRYGAAGSWELTGGRLLVEIKQAGGVRLIGQRVAVFSAIGQFAPFEKETAPSPTTVYYNFFAIVNPDSIQDDVATDTLLPDSLLLLANNKYCESFTVHNHFKSGYYSRNPRQGDSRGTLRYLSDSSSAPPFAFYTSDPATNDHGLGFVPPITVNGRIQTMYTASDQQTYGASTYAFDFNGRHLGAPDIYSGDPQFKVYSMFYDGHVLSVLRSHESSGDPLYIDRYIL